MKIRMVDPDADFLVSGDFCAVPRSGDIVCLEDGSECVVQPGAVIWGIIGSSFVPLVTVKVFNKKDDDATVED